MKLSVLIALVALSLAANAVLWLTLPRAHLTQTDADAALAREVPDAHTASGTATGHALPAGSGLSRDTPAAPSTRLPLDDLPALVSALREKGYPPAVLRALVATLVQKEFEPRYHALRSNSGTPQYWQTMPSGGRTLDVEARAARQRLTREHNERLSDLLWPDAPTPDRELMEISNRPRYGPLPTDTIARLQAIETDYNELVSEIRAVRWSGKGVDREVEIVRSLFEE